MMLTSFIRLYHTLYNFCTVTLSARYFDIIKDRLLHVCAAQSGAPLGANGAVPDR